MHAKTTSSATPEYQEFLAAEFSHLGSKQFLVFSFFSGGGGLDLGIEAAGFSTKMCLCEFQNILNTQPFLSIFECDFFRERFQFFSSLAPTLSCILYTQNLAKNEFYIFSTKIYV